VLSLCLGLDTSLLLRLRLRLLTNFFRHQLGVSICPRLLPFGTHDLWRIIMIFFV